MAQDTFIQAYQGVSKIRSDVSLKAWLYRIATNNALKFHRRRRVLSFVPMEASEVPGSTTTPEDIDEKIVVGEALLQVPPERRVCLVLHFVEGLKYREIADVVGASEEAVRKRVARGSKDFRRAYGCSSGDHVA